MAKPPKKPKAYKPRKPSGFKTTAVRTGPKVRSTTAKAKVGSSTITVTRSTSAKTGKTTMRTTVSSRAGGVTRTRVT